MSACRRIVFFGTPEFAVPTLDALAAASRPPLLVVTQPTRRAGRGRRQQRPAVLEWAIRHEIEVLQPKRVKEPQFLLQLEALDLDLAIVVAFGQIFPRRLIELPRRGCINLHASLLPAFRGASPISAAIAAGESETGVTTMWMEEGLDSGPILQQRSTPIDPSETAGELSLRLAEIGGGLMVETLAALEAGSLAATPQDSERATFAGRLKKGDGALDWARKAQRVHDLVRAMHPWPGAWTSFRDAPLRVISTRLIAAAADSPQPAPPGTLVCRRGSGLRVVCGDGTMLAINELQRPGRRVVSGRDFLNAEQPQESERFGESPPARAAEER